MITGVFQRKHAIEMRRCNLAFESPSTPDCVTPPLRRTLEHPRIVLLEIPHFLFATVVDIVG